MGLSQEWSETELFRLLRFTLLGFSQALGDVNNSGGIDIVDALLISQYYVGLNPPGFISSVADVNCSGGTDRNVT